MVELHAHRVIQVSVATMVYAQIKEEEMFVQAHSMQEQIVVLRHVNRVYVALVEIAFQTQRQ